MPFPRRPRPHAQDREPLLGRTAGARELGGGLQLRALRVLGALGHTHRTMNPCLGGPQVRASGEVACSCARCARWAAYVRGRLPGGPAWPQYEVLTAEFVAGLAAYMRQAAAWDKHAWINLTWLFQNSKVSVLAMPMHAWHYMR